MLKSRPDRYGTVAISIHWLTALLVLLLLMTGFQAADTNDSLAKAALLRWHIPAAFLLLVLTLARLVWWLRFDVKPRPLAQTWQTGLARFVHGAFYVVLLGMVASGIGMMVLSGAGPIVFGGAGSMPDFHEVPPRVPHGLGARLLVGMVLLHAGAALFHQLVMRDGTLRRMWFRR
ncbi:MAG: cytochrome b/b6 domain-containing protein [Natronohydrobacter sp.]|nr:cytochrome b/b6 domain-containing protein [Natronohydrobacter sp.]